MGIGFKIFLYGFLGMVASILIYNLVRLFRSHTGKLPPQQVETKTEAEGKPKGFWRRFWDNVKPDEEILGPDGSWERHRDEERKRLSDDFGFGLLRSRIHTQRVSKRMK